MKLASYLAEKQIPDSQFGARIGVTRQAIARYKSGERRPEWHVIDRIAVETDGLVTANDFMAAPIPSRDLNTDCTCPPDRNGCASDVCPRAKSEAA